MRTHSTQQEILLMIDTSFSSRQRFKKDNPDSPANLSEEEQLEEACWNGLLQQELPEIWKLPAANKMLYLWSIKKAASFIELELSEFPTSKDKYHSIDPYDFLDTQFYN